MAKAERKKAPSEDRPTKDRTGETRERAAHARAQWRQRRQADGGAGGGSAAASRSSSADWSRAMCGATGSDPRPAGRGLPGRTRVHVARADHCPGDPGPADRHGLAVACAGRSCAARCSRPLGNWCGTWPRTHGGHRQRPDRGAAIRTGRSAVRRAARRVAAATSEERAPQVAETGYAPATDWSTTDAPAGGRVRGPVGGGRRLSRPSGREATRNCRPGPRCGKCWRTSSGKRKRSSR